MVRATASISALVKFSVIGSPRLVALLAAAGGTVCAQASKGNRAPAPAQR